MTSSKDKEVRCIYCNKIVTYLEYRIEMCDKSPSKLHEPKMVSRHENNTKQTNHRTPNEM